MSFISLRSLQVLVLYPRGQHFIRPTCIALQHSQPSAIRRMLVHLQAYSARSSALTTHSHFTNVTHYETHQRPHYSIETQASLADLSLNPKKRPTGRASAAAGDPRSWDVPSGAVAGQGAATPPRAIFRMCRVQRGTADIEVRGRVLCCVCSWGS